MLEGAKFRWDTQYVPTKYQLPSLNGSTFEIENSPDEWPKFELFFKYDDE